MPRKTLPLAVWPPRLCPASMRPRPDAAENPRGLSFPSELASCASMRPRPDAAENPGWPRSTSTPACRFNEAAARCRGKRCWRGWGRPPRREASMRPRPDAAENGTLPWGSASWSGFNEAAARCRGKHEPERATWWQSMGFNEAAARCRGKPALTRSRLTSFFLSLQ